MIDIKEMQSEFEAFMHSACGGRAIIGMFEVDANGDYVSPTIYATFYGWQAATALAKAAQWKLMDNFPPVDLSVGLRKVILWDSRLKAHRIGHPLLENTSDCTHWMALAASPATRQGGVV